MKYFHIDAFTNEFFKGNSAGVVIYQDDELIDSTKQALASEFNHSETAFLSINSTSGISLQWFTPLREVDLCGHATIAAAHALWESNIQSITSPVLFNTKSGQVSAIFKNNKIELDFPQLKVSACSENDIVNKGLGIKPIYTGKNDRRYLLEIENADDLREIIPNFELLKNADLGAFMVTCKSDRREYDFLSRFFAPGVGINEDPVTGSAHCYLAPYWSKKFNKKTLIGFQESKRTGIVECEVVSNDRVKIRGSAITLLSSEIKI